MKNKDMIRLVLIPVLFGIVTATAVLVYGTREATPTTDTTTAP